MATFVEDLFGKSNRRRCVKGRSSYIEPSDNLLPLEEKVAEDTFNNSEDYSGYGNTDDVEVDDYDEEAVTIDLSDFLNVNPLLPDTSTENAVDSGVSDCHSQFRVTSSVTDTSQIVADLPPPKENESSNINEVINVNTVTALANPPPVVCENGVDVCTENSSTEIKNVNVSFKENIVNGVQNSPDKFPKPKLKGRPANPLKNSKNISKVNDFNKNNVKVFGKYPVVQCEKLDIDNFVKRNDIKVGNWPLLPVNNRKQKVNRNTSLNKKDNLHIIRQPSTAFSRPISFNKLKPNGTLDRARSILFESLEAKSCSPGRYQKQNLNKKNFVGGETLIKLINTTIPDSPVNNKMRSKFPIITSVNKMVGSPKTYQLISPKTNLPPTFENIKSNCSTPILPKPSMETISPMMLKDFTVIQPYVEDPTSPIKPQPILTVPLDDVPTFETVNTHVISSSVQSSVRPKKSGQSPFLNGGIQQISIPKKIGNKSLAKNTKAERIFSRIPDKSVTNLIPERVVKSSVSVVVDAIESVIDKGLPKKSKAKQMANKNIQPMPAPSFSSLGCNAYNSTLNDMLFGFDAFEAESFDDLNDSLDISSELCDSSTFPETVAVQPVDHPNIITENDSRDEVIKSDGYSTKQKVKTRKKTVLSTHDSDTWSASEGEDSTQVRMSYTARRKQRKSSNISDRKVRKNNRSHLKSPTFSEDSESTSDKILNISTKKISPEKLKHQVSEDDHLLSEETSEKLEHISEKPILDSQLPFDHKNKDLSSNCETSNSNPLSLEIAPDVDESLQSGKNKAKSKKQTLKNQPARCLKQKPTVPFGKGRQIRLQKRHIGKLSVKKPLSRPADIIKEINTITGANLSGNKKKRGKTVSAKENGLDNPVHLDKDNEIETESLKQKKTLRTKAKKKTLQVLFKRPIRKPNTRSLSAQGHTGDLPEDLNESTSILENTSESILNDIKCDKLETQNEDGNTLETEASLAMNVESDKFATVAATSDLKSAEVLENDHCKEKEVISNETATTDSILDNESTSDNIESLCNPICSENTLSSTEESHHVTSVELATNNMEVPLNETNATKVHVNDPAVDLRTEVENTPADKIDSTENTSLANESFVSSVKSLHEDLHNSKSTTSESIVNETNNSDIVNVSISSENLPSESKTELVSDHASTGKTTSRNKRTLKSMTDSKVTSLSETKQISNVSKVKKIGRPRKSLPAVETDVDASAHEVKKRGRPQRSKSIAVIESNSISESRSIECSQVLETNLSPKSTIASEPNKNKLLGEPESNSKFNAVDEDSGIENTLSTETNRTPESVPASSPNKSKKVGRPKKSLNSNTLIENNKVSDPISIKTLPTLDIDVTTKTVQPSEECESKKRGRPKKSVALIEDNGDKSVEATMTIDNLPELETNATPASIHISSKSKKLNRSNRSLKDGAPDKNERVDCLSDSTANANLKISENITPETDPMSNKRTCRNRKNPKYSSISEIKSTVTPRNSKSHPILPSENSMSLEHSQKTKDEVTGKNKRKSLKVKISVAKTAQGSKRHSSKNWYVSERKASTESIPSDEITVLKPSDRAELNKAKEARSMSQSICVGVVSSNEICSNESTTFVTNADVHVDATDIPDDDAGNSTLTTQVVIGEVMESLLRAVEKEVDGDMLPSSGNLVIQRCPASPIRVKQEPMDSDKVLIDSPVVNVKLEHTSPTAGSLKRKRLSLPAGKIMAKFAAAVNRASTPKSKAVKKIKLSMSTPASKSPCISVQSVPSKMRCKKFSYEAVTIPFTMGWQRELVHRSTDPKVGKKASDIYYFTPEYAKLRSMVDIGNYLSRHPECKLTLENFTYAKELIYRLPFERERDAKQKSVFVATVKNENTKSVPKKKLSGFTPKITTVFSISQTTPKSTKSKSPATKKQNAPKIDNSNSESKTVNEPNDSIKEDSAKTTTSSSRRQIKRRVPFDNSYNEITVKKKPKILPKPALSGNPSIVGAEINRELELLNQANPDISSSESTTTPDSMQSKNIGTAIPKTSQAKSIFKKTPSNKLKLKVDYLKNVDVSYESPCSMRCMVPRYVAPSIQCHYCLRFFHPQCYPRSAKNVLFECKLCILSKLATKSDDKISSLSNLVDTTVDSSPKFPDDFDPALLSPECILPQAYLPTTHTATVPLNIPGTLSPKEQTGTIDLNSGASTSQTPMSSSPQLLSHLLQASVSGTVTPVSQLSSATTPMMPAGLNSKTGRTYRIRLPMTPGAVTLPNQLVIRRMPDRRLLICSTKPPLVGHNFSVKKFSPIQMPFTGWVPASTPVIAPADMKSPAQFSAPPTHGIESFQGSSDVDGSATSHKANASKNGSKKMKTIKTECQVKPSSDKPESTTDLLVRSIQVVSLVFKRLGIRDLLMASQVSPSWKLLGSMSSLWEKVSFKGLTITDWKTCCKYLQKRGTKFLDLRDIIHPNVYQPWVDLEINVTYLSKIEELIIDHLPPSLLKSIISNMPLLRRFECHFVTTACTEPEIWSTPCEIELAPFRCLGRLVRLKIGSGGGITLGSGSEYIMPYLPNLRHVALTGFNFHSHVNLEFLSQLNDLISLELGNISSIEPGIYPLLGTLTNLKSLRLENGGSIDEVKFSEALSKMKRLEVLELMNFKISTRLADSLKDLKQLIHLNVWPDTTTENATINHNLFSAMSSVSDLKYVCWGVIAEGDSAPDVLRLKHKDKSGQERDELTFEDLFKKLVDLFAECRVEVKCVPRNLWREFCSTRK